MACAVMHKQLITMQYDMRRACSESWKDRLHAPIKKQNYLRSFFVQFQKTETWNISKHPFCKDLGLKTFNHEIHHAVAYKKNEMQTLINIFYKTLNNKWYLFIVLTNINFFCWENQPYKQFLNKIAK